MGYEQFEQVGDWFALKAVVVIIIATLLLIAIVSN